MKNNSIYKKIACALVLANTITVFSVTGCNTTADDNVNTGETGSTESTEAGHGRLLLLFGSNMYAVRLHEGTR